MLPNSANREVTLRDYIKIVKKRIGIIIACLIIIPVSAAIYVFSVKPTYRATVSILIERSLPKVTKFEDVSNTEAPFYRDLQYYQSQYKILGSRTLAERVFDELRLSKDADFQKAKDPVAQLCSMIKIEPVRSSQLVLVNVEDTDALRASAIANSLAKIYIRQDIENRNRAAKEAVGFLGSQITEIKSKLKESEEAFNKYILDNKIVTVPDIEKKTETLLESLKHDKSTLETDLAEARKRYKDKHPKVIAFKAQLDDVSIKIEQETSRLLELNQKLVRYNLLKKEVESNQQLYTSVLMRSKEINVSEKLETSSIRIVDPARPPSFPYKPQKARVILLSLFLSLGSGLAFIFFLEYLDSSLRTSEDVSTYLNLPFLGYIPSVDRSVSESERNLICFQNPKSITTESFRALRTSILFAFPEDRPLKSILVTSSMPREGKSLVAINLALVFCQMNEKVILIDLDMRRPKIHKTLKVEKKIGISDYLTGNVELDKVINDTTVPNLSFICAGTIPPNPSELLASAKIRSLIEELKTRFSRIILDTPPVLGAPDALILANRVDGVIFIIKGGSTRLEASAAAKNKLVEAKGKIIGAVINNIEPEKEDRYYYYHYYYSQEEKK